MKKQIIRAGLVVKEDSRAKNKADELEKWLRNKNVEVVRKEYLPPERLLSGRKKTKAALRSFLYFCAGR